MISSGCLCIYCAAEQGRTDGVSGVCVAEPLGECPEVSMPRPVNQVGWYQQQIAELSDENRALQAQVNRVICDLEAARGELATAKALGSRSGW